MANHVYTAEQINQINSELLGNQSILNVSRKLNVPYEIVRRMRLRLVNAGAVKPLRTKRKNIMPASMNRANQNNLAFQSSVSSFKLVINGTPIDIENVKSVFVSPELVDIKY